MRTLTFCARMALIAPIALLGAQASAFERISIPFNPSHFSHPLRIDNTFFTLTPGTTQYFKGRSDDGCELDKMTITSDTKSIDGITTRVVHDVVFADDQCNGTLTKAEDTLDYYAQDDAGNVWYMGERSQDCEDGKCTLNDGSWIAGKDIFGIGKNAVPGIVMLADPDDVGDRYRQEYYPGHAEDQAEVTAIDITVNLTREHAIEPKTFHHCIKTKEFSALEPDVTGFKYYCPKVGFILETEQPGNFRSERVDPPASDALQFRTVH